MGISLNPISLGLQRMDAPGSVGPVRNCIAWPSSDSGIADAGNLFPC